MDDIANLGIRIDTTDIRRATADLRSLGDAARRANRLTSQTGTVASNNLSASQREASNLNRELERTSRLFKTITRITVTWYLSKRLTDAVISAAKLSEELTFLQRKLSTVTMEADALGKVTSMAQMLGVDFTELGKGVTRFAVATRNAFDVDQLLKWQKGLVLSARAVGTTQKEIQSGIIQLSQSLSAGRLMGDEFRSIMENLPLLAVQLRKEFEGQTLSLKELSSQGMITNEVLIRAMEKMAEETEKYGNLTDTVDANLTRLQNSWKTLLNAMSSDTDGWVNSSIEKLTIVLDYWAKVFNTTTEEKIVDVQEKIARLKAMRDSRPEGDTRQIEIFNQQIFMLELQLSKYNQTLNGTAELEKKLAQARKENDLNKQNKEQKQINETLDEKLAKLNKSYDIELKYTNEIKALSEIAKKDNLTKEQRNKLDTIATLLTNEKFDALKKLNDESNKEKKIAAEFILSLQEKTRLSKLSGEELAIETELSQAHIKGITNQDEAIKELAKQYYALTEAKKANKSVDDWDEELDKIEKHWEKQEKHQQKQKDHLNTLAEKYSPAIAATAEYRRNIAEIAKLHEKGLLSGDQAAKAITKEWDELNEALGETPEIFKDIERNLSGLFSDILKGEEDAWRNFTNRILDMFTNMIADMTAKLVMSGILDVVSGLSGGVSIKGSSSGGFGIGDALNLAGTASSAAGLAGGLGVAYASGGIGTLAGGAPIMLESGAVIGQMTAGGTMVGSGTGMLGSLGGMGSTIATVAPYALAALAAYVVVDSIFGDTNRPTNASLFAGTSAQGYRETLLKEEMRTNKERTDYGYGVDSPFGAMVGEIGDFGHEGQQSAEEAKAWAQAMQAKLEVYAQIDEQIINALSLTPEQIADASMAMSDAMAGIAEGVGGGDTDAAIRARYEALFNEIGGVTDEVFDSLSGSMNNVLTTTLAFINATDSEKQVYLDLIELHNGNADITGQLILNFQAVNSTLEMLGLSAYDVSISGIEAADSLVEAAGGLQQLATLTGNFFNAFYSDTEKASYAVRNYTDTITALNEQYDVNLSTSVSSYKQTVQAVLDNAEADAELKVALLQLTPVVQQVVSLQEQSAQQATAYADAIAKENEARQQAIIDANNFASELYDKLLGLSETDIAQRTIDNLSEMLGIVDTSLAGITAYLDGLNLNIEADREALQAVGELTDARITLNDAEKEAALENEERIRENQEAALAFSESMKEVYYQLNDESQLDNLIRQIQEVYAEFGYFGSHTDFSREQLADFILTLDSMDENTRDAEGSITKLANAMIALDDYIATTQATIDDILASQAIASLDLQIDQQRELFDLEKERYDAAIKANQTIIDFLETLEISDLKNQSPLEQMNAAARLFSGAVSSGDAQKATQYGQEYLQFAQKFYGSAGGDYNDIFNTVKNLLSGMITDAGSEPTGSGTLDELLSEKEALLEQQRLDSLAQQNADLVKALNDMALAKDTSLFTIAEQNGVDLQELGTELLGGIDNWNNATVTSIAEYALDNRLTALQVADQFGVSYDRMLDELVDSGILLKDIAAHNVSISGYTQMTEQQILKLAESNKWSTNELARQLGVDNQSVIDYLIEHGATLSQIEQWNASVSGVSGSQLATLRTIDQSLLNINSKTYDLATEAGYGGQYSDNQLLQYMAGELNWIDQRLIDLNRGLGVTGYEKGTNFVPQDGLAFLHQGEMVIPRSYSDQLRSMNVATSPIQNQSAIVAELQDLKNEVKTLREVSREGFTQSIKQQTRTANAQIELTEQARI